MDKHVVRRWRDPAVLALQILAFLFFSQFSLRAAQSVTLTWSPSVDTNVVGYNVYYGTASRTYTSQLNVGNVTNCLISGLLEGQTYYFAATAYNILGVESDYSMEVSYSVPSPLGNQAPTLNSISDVNLSEDAAPKTVNLAGISAGSGESQPLTVTATSSNPALIPNPTINYTSPDATGTLTFAPTPNASGSAVITVIVDDGQPTNHTFSRAFTVTVAPVNDPPTLNPLANVTLNESSGLQTITLAGISSGAPDEVQPLTVTASSSNTGLIPNPAVNYTSPNASGTLTFTPVAGANGSATITVTVNDGQSANKTVTRTFTVTVNAVNDPPTLNALADLTISEDAALQTVNLSGITSGAANESQPLSVTATSSNPGLIPNPTVNHSGTKTTGSITFKPVADGFGTATITVTVDDGQAENNTFSRTFKVTVASVNDLPTLAPLGNLTIGDSAGPQTVNLSGIGSGAANEAQTLTVSATSDNPAIISAPAVVYSSPGTTGQLKFSPVAGANGTANIKVSVSDGGTSNNIVTQTFSVTVSSAPQISAIPNQTISVNSNTGPINFTISGTPLASLTLSVTSSSLQLQPINRIVFGGSGSSRNVTLTPSVGLTGSSTITIKVSNGSESASSSFVLTVLPPPPPPELLNIVTKGSGTVTFSSTLTSNGKIYSLSAIPGPGQEFAGWTGATNSNDPKITLATSSKTTVQANFITSPFPLAAGNYNGLFYEDEHVHVASSGSFIITVSQLGTYSGRLQQGKLKYSFSGKLDVNCHGANSIVSKSGPALNLSFQVGTNAQADQLWGQLTDGTWTASLRGDRAVFGKTGPIAPFAGNYTLVIPSESGSASVPAGHGFAAANISTMGAIKLKGLLADGSKLALKGTVAKDGTWPFYASLYTGGGVIIGWMHMTNQSAYDLNGDLNWIKLPNPAAPNYPGGFEIETEAAGSALTPSYGVNLFNSATVEAKFKGGNLPTEFSNLLQIDPAGKASNLSGNALSLKLTSKTGFFKGAVTDPVNGSSYGFGGVVLQKAGAGFGFLLNGNQSSAVEIEP